MANENKINDLGYLGEQYQEKLIKAFIEVPDFFGGLYEILDQNMFTDELHRGIVANLKNMYKKRGKVPNYFELETAIKIGLNASKQEWRSEQIIATIDKLKTMDGSGLDVVMDCADKFFKQQNLVKAINKATQIISTGSYNDYYKIASYFEKALTANSLTDYGRYNPFDEGWEHNLDADARITIPTGFKRLDNALNGGIAKTELGVIIAPAGTAKTSCTTGFVVSAALCKCEANSFMGYKVIHIHIEDSPTQISRKEYGFLLGIEQQDLDKPNVRPMAIAMLKEDHLEDMEMIKRNIVAYRPKTSIGVDGIRNIIKKNIAQGFIPDMVVVDYFEALRMELGEKGDDKWERERLTMRALEELAKEYNLAIWIPVQGSKAAFNQEDYGAEDAGGSVSKIQICHICIALARTDAMKEHNLLNLYIKKFRDGAITKDSSMINVEFNNGTSRFKETDNTTEYDNMVNFQINQNDIASLIKSQR